MYQSDKLVAVGIQILVFFYSFPLLIVNCGEAGRKYGKIEQQRLDIV